MVETVPIKSLIFITQVDFLETNLMIAYTDSYTLCKNVLSYSFLCTHGMRARQVTLSFSWVAHSTRYSESVLHLVQQAREVVLVKVDCQQKG